MACFDSHIWNVTALAVFACVSYTVATAADPSPRELFLTEAPEAWAALDEFTRGIEASGNGRYVLREKSGKLEKERKYSARILRNGELTLVHLVGRTTGKEVVFTIAKDRAFKLNRESPDSPYVIDEILSRRIGRERLPQYEIINWHRAPWVLDTRTLGEITADPGFVLKDVIENTDGTVRIEFDHHRDEPLNSHLDTTLTLAPHAHWSIRDYQYRTSWGEVSGAIEYGEPLDGFPVPRRVVQNTSYQKEPGYTDEHVFEFDMYARRKVPEREFTMAAFGITDVIGGERVLHLRTWLVVAGTFGLLLAVGLAWWARQRRQS